MKEKTPESPTVLKFIHNLLTSSRFSGVLVKQPELILVFSWEWMIMWLSNQSNKGWCEVRLGLCSSSNMSLGISCWRLMKEINFMYEGF